MQNDKRLKPCPKCGTKAFVMHDVVDGFDFGWSVGCPRYRIADGIHGQDDYDTPRTSRYVGHNYITKDRAIEAWNDRVSCGQWRIGPWDATYNDKLYCEHGGDDDGRETDSV